MISRHWRGLLGEYVAIILYRLKFYRILGHRVRNSLGELDIICCNSKTIVFVEVKTRIVQNFDHILYTKRQQQRVMRAALIYLNHHPQYNGLTMRFDLVLVSRYFIPSIVKNYTL